MATLIWDQRIQNYALSPQSLSTLLSIAQSYLGFLPPSVPVLISRSLQTYPQVGGSLSQSGALNPSLPTPTLPTQQNQNPEQLAFQLSDEIQTPVAQAMTKAEQSGNAQLQQIALQAYQLAFQTVQLTNQGQYSQAIETAYQALTLANSVNQGIA